MLTSTDPIADMLTRIRNALLVRKPEVQMPHSKIKQSVAELLQANGFIEGVKVTEATIGKTLVLSLNQEEQNARITDIQRLSKPGRRTYVRSKDIPRVKGGRGVVIVSTSKGVMTGDDAQKANIGGELICKVY